MVIDLKDLEEQVLPEFWGGMKEMYTRMYVDDDNRIFTAKLLKGASIGEHMHKGTTEIIYIMKGTGKGYVDGVETKMKPGMVQYCHSGHSHSLVNDGDEPLEFFAVVCKQE